MQAKIDTPIERPFDTVIEENKFRYFSELLVL